jgi:hypothetical protein
VNESTALGMLVALALIAAGVAIAGVLLGMGLFPW